MNIGGVGASWFTQPQGSLSSVPTSIRDEIDAKGGLVQWAKETRYEKLKAQVEQQILRERGLSEADLSKLSPEGVAAYKTSIAEEIARRVKEAVEQAQDGQIRSGDTSSGPVFVDISV